MDDWAPEEVADFGVAQSASLASLVKAVIETEGDKSVSPNFGGVAVESFSNCIHNTHEYFQK